ncbi:DUF4192 domain-containing protein [Lipingzhangella sp. LS1_29]|uniref:DUF4192 domain-containing protein n=1 Tax=Lipingzhangella rawalii TaxID=2055835 RepID=A0ABU2H7X4_9ACTN|nr:DUF4192 domain-containing protein [Lipingzhangella rawalii]MDS1271082.1 DUF4192 domain-containing protein [Lipingzhangella rawalii]
MAEQPQVPANVPLPSLTLTGPSDLLAAVPYLLGFHPRDSLVLVGIARQGSRQTICCSARCDLPTVAAEAPATAAIVTQPIHAANAAFVVLVGYGPAHRVTPCVDAVQQAVAARGVELREALRFTEGRYWSYTCTGTCCPATGMPFDPQNSLIPTQMVAAGFVAYADRSQLDSVLDPVTGPRRAAMSEATHRLEGEPPEEEHLRTAGTESVRAAAAAADHGALPQDPAELAWLCLAVRDTRVRDEAWLRIRPENAEAQLHLWQWILRNAEPRYRVAPGALAAFAAWQSGRGALANLALDRVLGADPNYPMALLLRRALQCGLPPQRWATVVPEQCPGGTPFGAE